MTAARVSRRRDHVVYAPSSRVPGTGRVAAELSRLSGWSRKTAQRVLGDGRAMMIAGWIIRAHTAAKDFSAQFQERLRPVEDALDGVPAEAYSVQLEIVEEQAEGTAQVLQTRYQTEQTPEVARLRVRAINAQMSVLARVRRSISARHGFRA